MPRGNECNKVVNGCRQEGVFCSPRFFHDTNFMYIFPHNRNLNFLKSYHIKHTGKQEHMFFSNTVFTFISPIRLLILALTTLIRLFSFKFLIKICEVRSPKVYCHFMRNISKYWIKVDCSLISCDCSIILVRLLPQFNVTAVSTKNKSRKTKGG